MSGPATLSLPTRAAPTAIERLPRALLHGALAVLRPGRLLALAVVAASSAALAALPLLLFWDEAVALAQGPLLRLAPVAWLLEHADAFAPAGARATDLLDVQVLGDHRIDVRQAPRLARDGFVALPEAVPLVQDVSA